MAQDTGSLGAGGGSQCGAGVRPIDKGTDLETTVVCPEPLGLSKSSPEGHAANLLKRDGSEEQATTPEENPLATDDGRKERPARWKRGKKTSKR